MGVSEAIAQALHAVTTAPRLFSGALKAGAGPAGALQVLRISEAALRTAAARGGGVPGRTNALRHFMWQAVLTARFGVDAARVLAAGPGVGHAEPRGLLGRREQQRGRARRTAPRTRRT